VGLPWDISTRRDKRSPRNTRHKHRRGVEVQLYLFLTSGIDGVVGQRHAPAALPPGKSHGTHCTGGCVGPVPVWWAWRKIYCPHRVSNSESIQHVESRYASYAIPAAQPQSGPHISPPLLSTAVTAVSRVEGLAFAFPADKYYAFSTAQLELGSWSSVNTSVLFSAWPGSNLGRYTMILDCHFSGLFCSPFRWSTWNVGMVLWLSIPKLSIAACNLLTV
jgi:hypothetical protein